MMGGAEQRRESIFQSHLNCAPSVRSFYLHKMDVFICKLTRTRWMSYVHVWAMGDSFIFPLFAPHLRRILITQVCVLLRNCNTHPDRIPISIFKFNNHNHTRTHHSGGQKRVHHRLVHAQTKKRSSRFRSASTHRAYFSLCVAARV